MKKIFYSILTISMAGSLSLSAKVYATIGDRNVTDKDIKTTIQMLPNAKLIERFGFDRLPKSEKQKIIEMTVENILLTKKAYQDGIDKTKEYQDLLKSMKDNLAVSLYTKKIISNIKVTDKEQKEYYEKHKDQFTLRNTLVKARHILVKNKEEAQKIIDELKKEKPENIEKKFIELAKSKSIGPSKVYGGELGWFNSRRMVPAFSKAAFSMKKGEFSKEPVKTQFGYHIIYIQDIKKKGSIKPYNEVQADVAKKLKREKIEKAIQKVIDEMKKSDKVTYIK